ncbi:XRE family transcriptional regulator [Enterococcus sp. AZ196]|uniref:XRE family transcriptional regulator n=1 Tax=Enterococcus sp. AZ196 TaxID=2774659 RepID=UPI003D2DAF1B
MKWFDMYKRDFGFTSNYKLAQATKIMPSSLTRLNNSNDWENVKIGTMIRLANAADKTLDDFVEYLRNQKV